MDQKKISEQVTFLLSSLFVKLHSSLNNELTGDLTFEIDPIHKLDPFEISYCLQLLSDNLGEYYISRHGINWKIDKLEEMQEMGLIYLRFKLNNELCFYVSFLCDEDNEMMVLYIYELQISSNFRNLQIGTRLINLLTNLIDIINQNLKLGIEGLSLTCFSDNSRLLNFYKKNGFQILPYSPQDKNLRNGKIIKPDYYILLKSV